MKITRLTKQFGTVTAVNKVSFAIDTPQMVGIIGPSGAGKSTLLRMINRLTDASGGSIEVNGLDILALKGKEKRKWQRVAIARALMQAPKMVLADEPIASLDPLSAEKVMTALREIRDRDHLTVICNLHTLDTARTYCDRVIGLLQGKIVFDDVPEKLTPAVVKEVYGADTELNESVTSTSMVTPVRKPDTRRLAPALAALTAG